jgi:hypothetical protein
MTPLVEEISPVPEPWDVVVRLARQSHLLFLDSAAKDSPCGRFSFITADPFGFLSSNPNDISPFPRLLEVLKQFRTTTIPELPPFQGGIAGLSRLVPIGRYWDRGLPDLSALPALLAARPEDAVTLVFQTASTGYLRPEQRAELRELLESAGREGPLGWISTRAVEEREEKRDDSYELEVALWPGGKRRFLLRCDFHGNWIRWRV